MYGRAFESTFSGSMVGSGANVFSVWFYVCSHMSGKAFYVELNPTILAALIGMTAQEASDAIHFLCQPDPNSRSKDEDGRRLVKEGAFLYRVVNGKKYKEMRDEDARRDYMKLYMRDRRSEEKPKVNKVNKSKQLTYVSKCLPPLAHAVSICIKQEANTDATATATNTKSLHENANGSVSCENSLFENSNGTGKPEKTKKKKEPAQKNGYNPCPLWVDYCRQSAKCPEVFITPQEAKMLTQMGNCYSEKVFRGMLVSYGKICRETGKIWKVFEFHRDRNGIRKLTLVDDNDASEEVLNAKYGGK